MIKERLNIRSDSPDWRAKILSNLAETPFEVYGISFRCVEAALQGIKFSNPDMQAKVFAMSGIDALQAGRKVTRSIQQGQTAYVYWQGKTIEYNSIEHRLLIAMFIREKIRQNLTTVGKALLATKGTFIYHDVGPEHPNTSLPEKFYIKIFLKERDRLEESL